MEAEGWTLAEPPSHDILERNVGVEMEILILQWVKVQGLA